MKTIAMYLPQFHRTKENDAWWGDGFTDWVSAKRAKPLFDGHKQPREPLNANYYNLLDKETMMWQAGLAKKYGVDGFCFYHYWFRDGQVILEKPAENLLEWRDVDVEFCFSWDSNAWVRTWSRLNFNYAWDTNSEVASEKDDDGILIGQKFGRKEYWKKHFDYLLPFFEDKRYIKKDNKPVFLIYAAENIYCLDDMVEYWNRLAIDEGLDGIYVIVTNSNEQKWENVSASLMQLPGPPMSEMIAKREYTELGNAKLFEYKKMWERALATHYDCKRTVYYGAMVDYDDSPRRKPGNVFLGANPEEYEEFLRRTLLKNYDRGNEFTFINAWNEWGEGMYLEPDKVAGYRYLEATKNAVLQFEKANKSCKLEKEYISESINDEKRNKMNEYFHLMNQWLFVMEDGKQIKEYFKRNGFNKIAIYGYGHLAKHLIFQIRESEIEIAYVIEQKKGKSSIPYKTYTLEEKLDKVDAIIVTPFMEYKEIRLKLKQSQMSSIISIKEVIMEM